MISTRLDAQRPAARALRLNIRAGESTIAADHYEGVGIPVLLLHGIPGDRATWTEVASRLARQHRTVIAPDLVGFGATSDSLVPLHAREQAEHLKAMLMEMGTGKVHIVGFDFGGPTAVHLAAMLGADAASIVLANTNVFPDTPVPPPLRIASVPYLGALAFRVFFSRYGLAALWFAAVRERRALPFATFRLTLRSDKTVRTTRLIFLESLRNLKELYAPVQRLVESSRIPALVIWSDRDPFFPIEVGERTARAARGRLCLLSCGHFTPQERPREFTTILMDHCETVENSPLDTYTGSTNRPRDAPSSMI